MPHAQIDQYLEEDDALLGDECQERREGEGLEAHEMLRMGHPSFRYTYLKFLK